MRISDWSSDVCSSDLHPYLVGGDTARSVLDAVRAARPIPGAAAGGQFAVWGESQGGHAAPWAAISAQSYAPEPRLVGPAAAAPPTDLADKARKSLVVGQGGSERAGRGAPRNLHKNKNH